MMELGHLEPSLYVVKAMFILDNDGNRVLSKHFGTFPTLKEQKEFERRLFLKTHRESGEIIMFEGYTALYRSYVDLYFYVMGKCHENELILSPVLSCWYDVINAILRKAIEKRTLLENLELILLATDEICDGGVILETEPTEVLNRILIRQDDLPLAEQSVTQVIQSAKEQVKWALLK